MTTLSPLHFFPMKKILLILLALGAVSQAQAAIYKYVDENGHVTYSDRPIKGGVQLDIEPKTAEKPSKPSSGKASPTPSSFPRVDKSEQKARDDKRRQILEDELSGERRGLEAAKEAYAEVEKHPEDYSQKTKKGRNMTKYNEKLQELSEEIKNHENNIEMLEQELSRM